MNSPIVSVIVPVYNVAEYLPRCLDSLLSQTFEDFELILTDDGSTDESRAICERYARQDSRIRVLHQENAGVSAARNRAIGTSRGAFLTFVDSDDTVEPAYLERLYAELCNTEADIAAVNWRDTRGKTAYEPLPARLSGMCLYTQDEFSDLNLLGSCCSRMFRRSSMTVLHFEETISYGEDTVFALRNFYGRVGNRLLLLDECLYNYCRRPGAATLQCFTPQRLSQIEAYRLIREMAVGHPALLSSVDALRAYAFWNLYILLLRSGQMRRFPAEAREMRRVLRKSRRYLTRGQGIRQRAAFRLYLSCGRLAVRLIG